MNYQEIQNYIKSQKPFNINDYIKVLIPSDKKELGKYFCPVCNNHNLHIGRKGEWQCWNEPELNHRREIIVSLTGIDYKKLYRDANYIPKNKANQRQITSVKEKPSELKEVIITGRVNPSHLKITEAGKHLPGIIKQTSTYYYYSSNQRAVRIDRNNHDKYFYYEHLIYGEWILGKGDKNWAPYGIGQLVQKAKDNYSKFQQNGIVVVEGQKCVDIANQASIAAVCLEGGDYSRGTIRQKLIQISKVIDNAVLIGLPDHDLSGIRKMLEIQRIATALNIPSIIIPADKIIKNPSRGDDIEQFIAKCQNSSVPPLEALKNCVYESMPQYIDLSDQLSTMIVTPVSPVQ